MATRLDSLSAIEAALWRELTAAPRDREHPWRTPVLATTDGKVGDARTVVVREVDPQARTLLVYTDARAPKAGQIARHPLGTLVAWSPRLSWQLRLRVRLSLQADGLAASSHWARLKLAPGAQDYLSALPPGSVLDNAIGARGDRAHFALVEAAVEAIDWLELHAQGHRRAAFDAAGARWLQP